MITLVWSSMFIKAVKKVIKKRPELIAEIDKTLNILEIDPFNPYLKTHKLKGRLIECWSCSIEYNYRIVFEIHKSDKQNNIEILLLTIGTHDEVY